MGGHKYRRSRFRAGHPGGDFNGRDVEDYSAGRPPPRRPRPISWIAVMVSLAVWSLVAWVGYVSVDGVLGWVAGNAGLAVDSGKDLATAAGVGKEAGRLVDGLDVGGVLGQVIALLRAVAKPMVIVLWAIGAVLLVAAPFILPRIERLLGALRH